MISESGSAYTWNLNAHEFRLTPWHNDAVRDASGETLYLRDEETGHYWSATPLPRCGNSPYVICYGFGCSCFEHREEGIECELWVYVAALQTVREHWRETLGQVRVETAEPRGESDAQRLAAVPGHCLALPGPQRFLPVWRRLRLP